MASIHILKTLSRDYAYKWVAKALKNDPKSTLALITRAAISIKQQTQKLQKMTLMLH